MFRAASLIIISKVDLAPYVDFDLDRCEAAAREVNPDIRTIRLSARTGEGLADWYEWLRVAQRSFALPAAE
jgi:hydrogenase nickel incorporation protein HypB